MTRRPNLVHPLAMLLGTMVEALEEEIHPSRTTPRLGGVDPMTTERTMATTMSQPKQTEPNDHDRDRDRELADAAADLSLAALRLARAADARAGERG